MNDINWDEIIDKAFEKAEIDFASEFSSLTRLTDDEVKEFVTTPVDQKRFAELVAVVRDETKSNQKKAAAISRIEGAMDLIVPILGKLL